MIKWLNNLSAAVRLVICILAALTLFFVFQYTGMQEITDIMLSWDVFCLFMIALSWITFFTVPHSQIRKEAQQQDESRPVIFIVVLAIVCISLVGILLVMRTTHESMADKELHRVVSIAGVALSWALLHTIFTLRYTHLYYSGRSVSPESTTALEFPNEQAPDYLDFAYFSFVIGMTFQVSDVVINSRYVRRVALLHGLISFVFNTAIVALSISLISNLLQ